MDILMTSFARFEKANLETKKEEINSKLKDLIRVCWKTTETYILSLNLWTKPFDMLYLTAQ